MSEKVLKNTMFSSINIYFEYFIGMIISILIARSLGPEEFGVYSYLIKIAAILIILANAGVGTAAIKFIAEARASENDDDIKLIHKYLNIIQLAKVGFVSIMVLLLYMISPELIVEEKYQALIFILIIAVALKSGHMLRVSLFKGFERFDYLAYTVLIISPLNLVVVIIAVNYLSNVNSFLTIYLFASFLYWVVSGFYLRKIIPKSNRDKLSPNLIQRIKSHLKIVSVNTVISTLIVGYFEVFLLKHFVNNEAVAFFNIGLMVSSAALMLVPGVYSSVLFPIIAKSVAQVEGDPGGKIITSSRYLFILGLLVSIPSAYYAQDIIVFLYGADFQHAANIFRVFILLGILRAFKDPHTAYMVSKDKQFTLLKISVIALLFSITMNTLFIYLWGLSGAVISYSVISTSYAFILLYLIYRDLKVYPELKGTVLILLSSIFSILISGYASSYLDNPYSIIIGFLLFGLCYMLFLIVLCALTDKEYLMLSSYSNNLKPVFGRPIMFVIDSRFKFLSR